MWKEDDMISAGVENGKCTIYKIMPDTPYNNEEQGRIIKEVNASNSELPNKKPKLRLNFKTRPKLKEVIRILQDAAKSFPDYLQAHNLSASDINIPNTLACFMRLKVNAKNITCIVSKLDDTNVLTIKKISEYLDEPVEDYQLLYSTLDKNYSFIPEDDKIILKKGSVLYTLKIIHPTYNNILTRIPKYMKELRKNQI